MAVKSSTIQFTSSFTTGETMFEINEYIPKGGWVKYRRRQELKERLKAGAFALLLLGGYALCGYLEHGG